MLITILVTCDFFVFWAVGNMGLNMNKNGILRQKNGKLGTYANV